MRSRRVVKATAVMGAAALILGAFVAGPADAKKKAKKPPACPAYTPYEKGASAPIALVTDAATAEAPVEVALETAQGLGTSTPDTEDGNSGRFVSHAYHNVQVDTASPTGGYLYVRLEFPGETDYDLYLRNPDGSSDTYSAGAFPYEVFDGTGNGGHSEGGPSGAAENIDGVAVSDCQGFTVDVVSATTMGGEVTLKYWLGEAPPA